MSAILMVKDKKRDTDRPTYSVSVEFIWLWATQYGKGKMRIGLFTWAYGKNTSLSARCNTSKF